MENCINPELQKLEKEVKEVKCMNNKDFKTTGDAMYDCVTDFGRKDMTQNYIKNLENDLKILQKDNKETKEANMRLLAGFIKILDMDNIKNIKNEVAKTVKEAKDILLNNVK